MAIAMAAADVEDLVTRTKAGDRRAAEALVAAIQNDVYRLSFRMLGLRAEAEDASQEILLQALTHLSEFRGESAFRTWLWRIAVRHLMRVKRGRREEIASFETIEMLIGKGDANPPIPALREAELFILKEEVRLSCTQGMVMSLERDQRISWILAEVFDLPSDVAADVLEIDAATHRKRLSRARERLAEWMGRHCGLANEKNACRCERQVPVALEFGVVALTDLEYARHPNHASTTARRRSLPLAKEATEIENAAEVLRGHPDYAAPGALVAQIRALIDSGKYRMFDA
jgi:RNA polymerase sigma factor (sigma-70 family)